MKTVQRIPNWVSPLLLAGPHARDLWDRLAQDAIPAAQRFRARAGGVAGPAARELRERLGRSAGQAMRFTSQAAARLAARERSNRPRPAPEEVGPGLYAILGVPASATDQEVQVTYRRRAARLAERGRHGELRELNVAYEVLGNPARRAEYDEVLRRPERLEAIQPAARSGVEPARAFPRMRHPHQQRLEMPGGLTELLVVLAVVAGSLFAAVQVLTRANIDLSALESVGSMLGVVEAQRPGDAGAVPTPAPVSRPEAAAAEQSAAMAPLVVEAVASVPVSEQFRGSAVSVSNPTPAQNTPVDVRVRLVRNGRPAAGVEVWTTAQYRTLRERWPQAGAVQTDQNGEATVTFNVGDATRGHTVRVEAHARVDGEELSWATSFTPR